MNLPVLNVPHDYADGRWRLHRRADGSSVLVLEHAQTCRAIYFDESSRAWRELVKHISEL